MPVALLSIGINYNGQLQGCIRDSINVIQYFSSRHPLAMCRQMIDTLPQSDPMYPSRVNIERQLKEMCSYAKRYSQIIIHYSGHGSQTRDRSNDESDGRDEVLVPVDYQTKGFITDDWLLQNVIVWLPVVTSVLFIVDACHSGTVLDLRYSWNNLKRGGLARVLNNPRCSERPNVVLISGCLDHQYSYETTDPTYGVSGALTSALLTVMCRQTTRHPLLLLLHIQQQLNNRVQTAQISCTRPNPPNLNM